MAKQSLFLQAAMMAGIMSGNPYRASSHFKETSSSVKKSSEELLTDKGFKEYKYPDSFSCFARCQKSADEKHLGWLIKNNKLTEDEIMKAKGLTRFDYKDKFFCYARTQEIADQKHSEWIKRLPDSSPYRHSSGSGLGRI